MTVEIRPVKPEELDDFKRVASTALVENPEDFKAIRPEWTLCAFEDGNLATSYAAWPLIMRFNGEGIPVAGVTMVGTLPVYRRRGHLRRIVNEHFKQLRKEGERSIAILIAAWAAIYQRFGYAVVSTRNNYTIDPRYLAFALPRPVTGSFREIGEDEFPLMVDLYRKFRAEKTGYLHRGRPMWDAGVLAPQKGSGVLGKVVYLENNEPLGYLVYAIESGQGPGRQNLNIRDLIWLTASAYRAAWNFLRNMDWVGNIRWGGVPGDDPLPHLLLEPRRLNISSGDGLLGRIIDVEKALPGRPYPEEATLIFEIIDDDLCPWNQGRWKLETSTTRSTISQTKEKAQVIMPISTLALLVFGQISATEAARMKRIDVIDDAALPLWDRVMKTRYIPCCADNF